MIVSSYKLLLGIFHPVWMRQHFPVGHNKLLKSTCQIAALLPKIAVGGDL